MANTSGRHSPSPSRSDAKTVTFSISGRAAHGRIAPLLPPDWVDVGPYAHARPPSPSPPSSSCSSRPSSSSSSDEDAPWTDEIAAGSFTSKNGLPPQFIWENAARHETRPHRDSALVYSHLPNGTSVLDDKWALARLIPGKKAMKDPAHIGCFDEEEEGGESGDLAALESHCFRGPDGFREFCDRVGLFDVDSGRPTSADKCGDCSERFSDLLNRKPSDDISPTGPSPPQPDNLWVVKDASANGAGGIWVVDRSNAESFLCPPSNTNTPLFFDGHRYVAQRYAWPPVLYGGRKCHVRVYGLITSDGRAYIHRRCFLHVANETFAYGGGRGSSGGNGNEKGDFISGDAAFDPSMHITNCCANSHDASKFSGEICADLSISHTDVNVSIVVIGGEQVPVVPLGEFFPSIAVSMAVLARRSMPFVGGGEANGGFEYLGLDFILSRSGSEEGDRIDGRPAAFLLEVNAPPSQDTATGLGHAEDLHDEVLRDLISLWVVPRVTSASPREGGWKRVFNNAGAGKGGSDGGGSFIVPSKAAILNKFRWALFERRMSRLYDEQDSTCSSAASAGSCAGSFDDKESLNDESYGQENNCTVPVDLALADDRALPTVDDICAFARSQFPYYAEDKDNLGDSAVQSTRKAPIFLESAGGSQVPHTVVCSVALALSNRHRSSLGARHVSSARRTLLSILGASPSTHRMFLGHNATSLLDALATSMVRTGFLNGGDEVVVSSENHRANSDPWVKAATRVGAKVRWWAGPYLLGDDKDDNYGCNAGNGDAASSSPRLDRLLSRKTRVVAVPHTSNLLGIIRDIQSIGGLVKRGTGGRAQVVVDGVAAVPHVPSDLSGELAAKSREKECGYAGCWAGVGVDWYAVSCHKAFGPHLGGLCGRHTAVREVARGSVDTDTPDNSSRAQDEEENCLCSMMENGTLNYESCAGVQGMAHYLLSLGSYICSAGLAVNENAPTTENDSAPEVSPPRLLMEQTSCQSAGEERRIETGIESTSGSLEGSSPIILSSDQVFAAYRSIRIVESKIVAYILPALSSGSTSVCILGSDLEDESTQWEKRRIPIISFVHKRIDSSKIAGLCADRDIICRAGTFLATDRLQKEQRVAFGESSAAQHQKVVVRLSFAHYNTLEDARRVISVLKSIKDW